MSPRPRAMNMPLPLPLLRQIEEVCTRFEEACQTIPLSSDPLVPSPLFTLMRSSLEQVPEQARPRLLRELLLVLMELTPAGRPLSEEVLCQEFPCSVELIQQVLCEHRAGNSSRPSSSSSEIPLCGDGSAGEDSFPPVAWVGGSDATVKQGPIEEQPASFRPLPAGTDLGPYQVVGFLGKGGMGEVYRARDVRLDREVAVKVLPAELASNPDRLSRFQREARAVARVAHPNIVVLYDIGEALGRPFVVMELLEGESLRERLECGVLASREVLELGGALAEGLMAAHGRGIIHRDIKPENLFLTREGRLKILDFGLARLTGAHSTPRKPPSTSPGTILGTVGYMSPEQVRGKEVDARSDLFAFGCVLYELLTGDSPFARESAAETMTAILHEDPFASGRLDHHLTQTVPSPLREGLLHLLQRCLAKDREQRIQTADEVVEVLRRLLRQESSSSGGLGPPPPSTPAPHTKDLPQGWSSSKASRMLVYGTVGLLVVLALAGVGYWLNSSLTEPTAEVPEEESVAVLPFVLHGENGQREDLFLQNHIPITLINQLRREPDIKVMSFSAVAEYSGDPEDVHRAFRDLGVRLIVRGAIHQRMDTLLISVELIQRDGTLVWGEQYRSKSLRLAPLSNGGKDVPPLAPLQAVVDRIVREVLAHVTRGSKNQPRQGTENYEALREQILGQVEWNRRSKESLKRALGHFEAAIKLDRRCVEAYAGKAYCCINLAERNVQVPEHGILNSPDAYRQARAAAEYIIHHLDPNSADAYVALGMIAFEFDWDFRKAELQFQKALSLSRNHPTGHQWYGECLSAMGKSRQALEQLTLAQKYNPRSAIISTVIGVVHFKGGNSSQAIAQHRKTLEEHKDFHRARGYLADVYEQEHRIPEAINQWEIVTNDKELIQQLRQAYQSGGLPAYWKKRIALWDRMSKYHPVSRIFLAGLYARLKQNDKALKILNEAYLKCDGALAPNIKVHPCFANLHQEKQYQQLLERMHFKE